MYFRFLTFSISAQLCTCIQNYINQTGWLDGVATNCSSEQFGHATLELTGKPDPSYNANATPPEPLEILQSIFIAFPKADLAGLKCALTQKNISGCIHCYAKCARETGDTRTKHEILQDAYNYFNQNKWLKNTTREAYQNDRNVFLEFSCKLRD